MSLKRRAGAMALAIAASTVAGCGDSNNPGQSPATVSKPATKSGDQQTGPVSQPLASELRVVVTRDGAPAPDVTINWITAAGTLSPASDKTDPDGVSSTIWTLGATPGTQTATAGVAGGAATPITFTATGVTGTPGGVTIQVLSATTSVGNRFSPAAVTVTAGTTVTWNWGDDLNQHNVVPDATEPVTSGGLVSGPHTYQYTFNTVGTFVYHCVAHGAAGGVGMSGTVTVSNTQP